MPSLIFRRQSTVRHRPTSLDTGYSYTASIDATTPNHEDFFSNDTLPAQSSLLTTSFVSPLRKAMKLSGVLEQIPSSVGSTSTHRSSVPPPITSSRRKEVRSIGPIFTTKPNRPTKPLHSTLTRAPIAHERRTSNDLPDLHVQVYLPAEQLKVGPLKLEICAEATVKELVSLALRTDRDSEITGRWILRPVQDHFVDYENLALSPLDKVQTFDTRVFALSSVDFEGKHRKRSTHRRCYTLLSNGEEVLDMDGTNGQFRPRAKLFRVRVDLANSADIIQIHVSSRSCEVQELTQFICKKLYGEEDIPTDFGLIGHDVQGILRPIPAMRRVMTFAEHTEFVLVSLAQNKRSRSASLSEPAFLSSF